MNNAEPVTLQIECRAEVAERIVAILKLENEPQVATTAEQLEVLEKELHQADTWAMRADS